jgi:hypothetical protein
MILGENVNEYSSEVLPQLEIQLKNIPLRFYNIRGKVLNLEEFVVMAVDLVVLEHP